MAPHFSENFPDFFQTASALAATLHPLMKPTAKRTSFVTWTALVCVAFLAVANEV